MSLLLRGRSNFFDWEIQLRLALKNVDLIDLWLPELSDIHAKHTARHNYSTLIQSWLIKQLSELVVRNFRKSEEEMQTNN